MLNDASLVAQANAWKAAFPYVAIHTAGATSSSANESTAARELANWATDADGDLSTPSDIPFTGGAGGGPAVRVGYWSSASGGTYGGGQLLDTAPPNDGAFNGAGEFTLRAGLVESNTST